MRHSGTQAHISAWCSCESVCVRAFVRKRMCASCVLSVLFGGGTHRISHILCYVFLKRACVYYMLSRCFARFHGYFFGHDTISRSLSPAVRRLVFISLPLSRSLLAFSSSLSLSSYSFIRQEIFKCHYSLRHFDPYPNSRAER